VNPLYVFFAVAFSVRTNQAFGHFLNLGQNTAILFTAVVTNIGNGYSAVSGHFTAPYSGIYMFSFTMRMRWNHPYVHVGIYKNYDLIALAAGDPKDTKGVAMVTTHLDVGDSVYCRRQEGDGTDIEDSFFTTFSGFLISPD